MSIQLPSALVIDDRLIIAAVAALGLIIFLIVAGPRLWRAARQAFSQTSSVWLSAVVTLGPLVAALVLAFAAALIWPKLGIAKDTFQTQIGVVPLQVSGQAGVFTVVFIGALVFVEKIVSQQLEKSQAEGKPAIPPVTTKANPKRFPPDPRNGLPSAPHSPLPLAPPNDNSS